MNFANGVRVGIAALALAGASLFGLDQIKKHEGEVLTAMIPVPGDVPTIGVGVTTYEDGTRVKLGDSITAARSQQLMSYHAKVAGQIVAKCAPVPMHQHEFDAFVGFVYNVGGGAKGVKDGFCVLKNGQPSSMRRHLLAGNYDRACAELLKWVNFQGKPLKGLVKRRSEEYALCRGLL